MHYSTELERRALKSKEKKFEGEETSSRDRLHEEISPDLCAEESKQN
jgi:hypothetical protein